MTDQEETLVRWAGLAIFLVSVICGIAFGLLLGYVIWGIQ